MAGLSLYVSCPVAPAITSFHGAWLQCMGAVSLLHEEVAGCVGDIALVLVQPKPRHAHNVLKGAGKKIRHGRTP